MKKKLISTVMILLLVSVFYSGELIVPKKTEGASVLYYYLLSLCAFADGEYFKYCKDYCYRAYWLGKHADKINYAMYEQCLVLCPQDLARICRHFK